MTKFIVALLLFFSFVSSAQEVTTNLQPSKIMIGDRANISFSLQIPANARVDLPIFNEKINENIEILSYGSLDTLRSRDGSSITLTRSLVITSWEEGLYPIIPIEFTIIQDGDTLVWESEPVLLEVESLVLGEDAELKDIKGIIRIPLTLREILPWVLLALLLAFGAYWGYKYYQRRKARPQPESIWEKPDVPAHVAAISSLENLKAQKLWQQGKVKLYYIELTDILRRYLDKRFQVDAPEMTTDETLRAVEPRLENNELTESLRAILQLADLVKFAKHVPLEAENDSCMDNAIEFVKDTRLSESIEEKQQNNIQ